MTYVKLFHYPVVFITLPFPSCTIPKNLQSAKIRSSHSTSQKWDSQLRWYSNFQDLPCSFTASDLLLRDAIYWNDIVLPRDDAPCDGHYFSFIFARQNIFLCAQGGPLPLIFRYTDPYPLCSARRFFIYHIPLDWSLNDFTSFFGFLALKVLIPFSRRLLPRLTLSRDLSSCISLLTRESHSRYFAAVSLSSSHIMAHWILLCFVAVSLSS